jgi:hypothetical protein
LLTSVQLFPYTVNLSSRDARAGVSDLNYNIVAIIESSQLNRVALCSKLDSVIQ